MKAFDQMMRFTCADYIDCVFLSNKHLLVSVFFSYGCKISTFTHKILSSSPTIVDKVIKMTPGSVGLTKCGYYSNVASFECIEFHAKKNGIDFGVNLKKTHTTLSQQAQKN